MEKYKTDETFLARWAVKEITEEERLEFEKTDAFREFDLIIQESNNIVGLEIDTESAFKKVDQSLKATISIFTKKRFLQRAMAACFILLFASLIFFNHTKAYKTGIGEKKTITLSDGSIVFLNANSILSKNRFFWSDTKKVWLEGEAYFNIVKSKNFQVVTSKGLIMVLGTQFNIYDRNEFEIKCYEGSVDFKVDGKSKSHLLKKNIKLFTDDGKIKMENLSEKTPSWKLGISDFKNKPFYYVLAELENQYPIKFQQNNVTTDRLFTGEFVHNDLKRALKATLIPMGIKYSLDKTNTVILSE